MLNLVVKSPFKVKIHLWNQLIYCISGVIYGERIRAVDVGICVRWDDAIKIIVFISILLNANSVSLTHMKKEEEEEKNNGKLLE